MSYRRSCNEKKKYKRYYPWFALCRPDSEWNNLKVPKRYYYSNCRKFLKRCTNRRIRRNKKYENIAKNPSYYRKIFDYWWNLF